MNVRSTKRSTKCWKMLKEKIWGKMGQFNWATDTEITGWNDHPLALEPGALACTVTHVALVPIDVAPWLQCGLELEHLLLHELINYNQLICFQTPYASLFQFSRFFWGLSNFQLYAAPVAACSAFEHIWTWTWLTYVNMSWHVPLFQSSSLSPHGVKNAAQVKTLQQTEPSHYGHMGLIAGAQQLRQEHFEIWTFWTFVLSSSTMVFIVTFCSILQHFVIDWLYFNYLIVLFRCCLSTWACRMSQESGISALFLGVTPTLAGGAVERWSTQLMTVPHSSAAIRNDVKQLLKSYIQTLRHISHVYHVCSGCSCMCSCARWIKSRQVGSIDKFQSRGPGRACRAAIQLCRLRLVRSISISRLCAELSESAAQSVKFLNAFVKCSWARLFDKRILQDLHPRP